MSSLDEFLRTWAGARRTFGEGTPQGGDSYDQSQTLDELQCSVAKAGPDVCWTGDAAEAYRSANTNQQRVIGSLAELDKRLAGWVDTSAQIVTEGRRELDLIRDWVVAAASSAPNNRAGDAMMSPIVLHGLMELSDVVTRINDQLGAVADEIGRVGSEYQALGNGERRDVPEGPVLEEDLVIGSRPEPESNRRKNEVEAFRGVFGRDPVGDSDWLSAAALDPHSYSTKNQGVSPSIAVARIEPAPGQGVVRTNLFIPSEDVWNPQIAVPPYDNNLGDNRGFSPTAGPEDSRVTIYTDFDNGLIVARQNPSINSDTGEVRTGTPSIGAVQQSNGAVLIQYNAADPFSPGGGDLAVASGISVNGTLGIAPSELGPPRVGGADVTTFPALEIYSDRGGTAMPLLKEWPTFLDNAAGPLVGLPFDKDVGDLSVVHSFNSVVPQPVLPTLEVPRGVAPVPLTPPMSVLPPGNFTPFGPPTDAPEVRVYTTMTGFGTVTP